MSESTATTRLSLMVALVACFLALASHPAPADARAEPVTILDATNEVLGFQGGPVREAAFDDLETLGVDTLRILVWWADLTPKPGARKPPPGLDQLDSRTYGPGGKRFNGLDFAVREAVARGITPYLVPTSGPNDGRIPRWAARRPDVGAIDPRPKFFKRFMYAIGERYAGGFDPDGPAGSREPLPRVPMIGVMNEPNAERYLAPQRTKKGKPYSPGLYRKLFLAGQKGLHVAGWRGKLLIGETSPRAVQTNVEPLAFLRGVLCLDNKYRTKGRCAKLHADGWAHHPYALKSPPWLKRPDRNHVSIGSLDRLKGPLNRAARAGRIDAKLPIYITEFGYQSVPDREFGLSLPQQAEYLSIAERIAHSDHRVASYAQYLLHDDPFLEGFQSGLRYKGTSTATCGGRKQGCKPSFKAFITPLAVRLKGGNRRANGKRTKTKASIWGHARPATGATTVVIRFRDPGKPARRLKVVRTDTTGHFILKSGYRKGRRWGITWNGHKGPLVRGYRY